MKINLGLFFGGKSVEHEVAVISALQTYEALDKEKYEVIPVYISKDNELYTGEALKKIQNFKDLNKLLAELTPVVLHREKGKVFLQKAHTKLFQNPIISELDVAFPVVHGTNCEDGTVEGFLSLYGLPVVGSDVCGSAVGMDKWVSKCVLQSVGLPVLPGLLIYSKDYKEDPGKTVFAIEEKFGYPVIVKPVNLGSSVGISKGKDPSGLIDALDLAVSFADRILIEPLVENLKEINCAVLGDGEDSVTSALEEPISSGDILTYADKYQSGGGKGGKMGGSKAESSGMTSLKRKLPAEISEDCAEEIKDLAKKAFKALDLAGVSRIDFIQDLNTGKIYINELNTIPGSLAFYLWEYEGISFTELTDRMIKIALKKARMKEKLNWNNEVNLLASSQFSGKGKA